jgi:uncharacterized protein (DUF2126 family)
MARSPARAAALAALFRAIAARLASEPGGALEVIDWGDALSDRWLLPFFLLRDLDAVLAELREAGLGLGDTLESELRSHPERIVGTARLGGPGGEATLTITRAIELWPLVGDASSQEQRATRWIDASTRRLELCVSGPAAEAHRLAVGGVRIPLTPAQSAIAVAGLRIRTFAPRRGLHPDVPPHVPLTITWAPPEGDAGLEITLHDWRPGGGAYDGLPLDDDEAARRRAERFVVRPCDAAGARWDEPPPGALRGITLDRRAW